jgi:hypothetical protein
LPERLAELVPRVSPRITPTTEKSRLDLHPFAAVDAAPASASWVRRERSPDEALSPVYIMNRVYCARSHQSICFRRW